MIHEDHPASRQIQGVLPHPSPQLLLPLPRAHGRPQLRGVSLTHDTIVVGLVMARDPEADHWAYQVALDAGLENPTVARILKREREAGWFTCRTRPQKNGPGGPPRICFQATAEGLRALTDICTYATGNKHYAYWLSLIG